MTATDNNHRQKARINLTLLAGLLALTAIGVLMVSGSGYQAQWWQLSTAFTMLRWGAWLGAAAALLAAIACGFSLWYGPRSLAAVAAAALLAGALAAAIPYAWQQQARSVPPIHDISTDTDNPPAFVAIAALRRDAPNPVEYAGAETAQAQQQAYPDLAPMLTALPQDILFDNALASVSAMGWELVDASPEDGRIEATDTTRWFGFKDDVVIRIVAENGGSRLDLRSKSRVGRSDVGTNARRIRDFQRQLKDQLPAESTLENAD